MKMSGYGAVLLAMSLAACSSEEIVDAPTASTLSPDEQRILEWSTERAAPASPTTTKDAAPVSDLLSGLEARLAENPNDASGWTLLAQSYAFMGRMSDAKRAAEKAVANGSDPAEVQSLLMAAHTRTNGR